LPEPSEVKKRAQTDDVLTCWTGVIQSTVAWFD